MFIFFLCTEHTGIEKRRKKGWSTPSADQGWGRGGND
jgi:hypothetical protein